MHTTQQILAVIGEEIKIIRHLFGKMKPEQLTFSPGENMRTTEELLRYLSYVSASIAAWHRAQIKGEDASGLFKKYVEEAQEMDINTFPDAMDEQYKQVATILNGYSDADLQTKMVKTFAGKEITLGEATVKTVITYLSAYRMQLFLYLKQSGQPELGTYNCWMGIDPPPRE